MPRGESYFGKQRVQLTVPAEVMRRIRTARDREWTRVLLGITDKILTPEQAAKWLESDRVRRARTVADARPRRTPPNW
jgi:hypothetical protein